MFSHTWAVRRVHVMLDDGIAFAFAVDLAAGLVGASDEALSVIELTPAGQGLHWPRLDADLSVPGLMQRR